MANTHIVVARVVSPHGKEFLPGVEVDAAAEFGCYIKDVQACLKPLAAEAPVVEVAPVVALKAKS